MDTEPGACGIEEGVLPLHQVSSSLGYLDLLHEILRIFPFSMVEHLMSQMLNTLLCLVSIADSLKKTTTACF